MIDYVMIINIIHVSYIDIKNNYRIFTQILFFIVIFIHITILLTFKIKNYEKIDSTISVNAGSPGRGNINGYGTN